jgi:hypothetical protein
MDTIRQAKSRAGAEPPRNSDTIAITGLMLTLFVRVRPNINSFQHHLNWLKKTTVRGATDIGTSIWHRIVILEAPSSLADSNTSREIPLKKFRITNMAKGMQMAI